jgi:ABC-2 type transport system ATP-binding protein
MIEVEGLTKRYGSLTAIEGVSFSMQRGEVVGFLGVNGAGKTTTMRILTCYMPPSDGRAAVAGHDVVRDSLAARRHIGYLPETVPLYTEMRVSDYLDYMARLRGVRRNRAERIEQVMTMVNVDHLADRIVGTLSKGQRQRVGIGQAIVHNPDVLVLDEPTIGLDPRQIREVRALIRQLGQAHTILLSTHILPEVAQVCDRVLIISDGMIRADMSIGEATLSGLPERVTVRVDAPADVVVPALQALAQVGEVRVGGDGALEVARAAGSPEVDLRPLIARAVADGGWPLLELRGTAGALEDLFMRLTASHEPVDGHGTAGAGADEDEEDEYDESEADEDFEDEDDDDDEDL